MRDNSSHAALVGRLSSAQIGCHCASVSARAPPQGGTIRRGEQDV